MKAVIQSSMPRKATMCAIQTVLNNHHNLILLMFGSQRLYTKNIRWNYTQKKHTKNISNILFTIHFTQLSPRVRCRTLRRWNHFPLSFGSPQHSKGQVLSKKLKTLFKIEPFYDAKKPNDEISLAAFGVHSSARI